jgi:hypothetical protein
MATETDRAVAALEDIVAIERVAPGMVRVVTWSDSYTVDARGDGCLCPDKEYNLDPEENCKHRWAAVLATSDELPAPWGVADDLDQGPEPLPDFEDFEVGVEYV